MPPRQECRIRKQGRLRKLLTLATGIFMLPALGCVECLIIADRIDHLSLHGTILDAETLTPLSNAVLGGRAFTAGEVTAGVSALNLVGAPIGPRSGDDGSFILSFVTGFTPLGESLLGPRIPPPVLARPDQIEVTVVRDGCESSFLIDVNEDTIVDLDFPDDVIELTDPILVPPCEE